ncbi:hypothetical protein BDQ17DRAFT_1427652 [Cyathus striatus]|nr:hypothetical protein BDQ17DRAFT_1427652 [Cyathus striatus]
MSSSLARPLRRTFAIETENWLTTATVEGGGSLERIDGYDTISSLQTCTPQHCQRPPSFSLLNSLPVASSSQLVTAICDILAARYVGVSLIARTPRRYLEEAAMMEARSGRFLEWLAGISCTCLIGDTLKSAQALVDIHVATFFSSPSRFPCPRGGLQIAEEPSSSRIHTNRDIPLPATPTSNDHSLVPQLGHPEEPSSACGYTIPDIPLSTLQRPMTLHSYYHHDTSKSFQALTDTHFSVLTPTFNDPSLATPSFSVPQSFCTSPATGATSSLLAPRIVPVFATVLRSYVVG